MNHFFALLACGGLAVSGLSASAANLEAFPGAQGWGRFAKGGRAGSVYHVTNLNDSGTGSLRDAISASNRIIVFDVAGVINISSRLVFSSNLYVAGQTAPGEGITVYGNGVSFSGSSNIICRYMRFRMGHNGDSGKDCAGIANGTNMMFDHCSFAWGLDETFSINPSSGATINCITLQNCVIGQGLLTHSAGGLMQADSITLYRNFYCDNSTRNNKIKGVNQYVNNVVYNWKNGAYLMGGDSSGESHVNAQGSVFINGPAGGGNGFSGGNELFHIYADDNWQDKDKDGSFNPYLIPQNEYSGGVDFQSVPYDYPQLDIVPASGLLDDLLPTVGASLPYRDYVDYYMVDECRSYGTKGVLISTEANLPYGIPSSWTVWGGNTRVDSDGDGMPDAWETAHGTNPDVNDAMTIAANGYTNIENYINSITAETVDFFLRAPMTVSLAESTPTSLGITWADYTYNEDGFVVEIEREGAFVEAGRVGADVNHLKITGDLQPGTGYNIRVYAYKGTEKSAYSQTVLVKTQPEQVEMVDCDNYDAHYEWNGGNGLWDFTSDQWIGGLYTDGKRVLFPMEEAATVSLADTLRPESVVVRGNADLTLTGAGAIGGTASVNKAGTGALILATDNSYTGATAIHGGTVELATLKNGGVNSSIGASQEFAQNWIWYGGIWNYTGASTSTNRSAKIYKDTELSIADPDATVKMTGALEGNGGFVLNGKGTLEPSTGSFFNYEGNTVLRGGTLYLNGVSTMWSDKLVNFGTSPKLVLAGGTLKTKDANDTYSTYQFPIEVESDTYSTVYFNRNCSIASTVTGDGTLEYQASYLREYITGNWDGFTGNLVVNGVNSKAGECQFMMYNNNGIPNAPLYLKGNVQVVCWKASATVNLGGVSGDAGTYLSGFSKNTTTSKGTWVVGNANTDETFNGIIDNRCSASGKNGTVSIQKVGNGYWRLTGKNVYSGTTTISAGKLIVNGTNSGTGAVTVAADATLAGTGTVAGATTIEADGELYAGDSLMLNANTLTLTGAVKVKEGGIVSLPLLHTAALNKSNRLVFKGNLTLENAILRLDMANVTAPINAGSYFQLFDLSAVGTISGAFASIEPAIPAEGQVWDTSDLLTLGRLYVRTETSAIEQIGEGNRVEHTMLYDMCGNVVAEASAKGVYIRKSQMSDGTIAVKRVVIK